MAIVAGTTTLLAHCSPEGLTEGLRPGVQLGDFVERDAVEATTEAHNTAVRAGRHDLAAPLGELARTQAAALTDREELPELL